MILLGYKGDESAYRGTSVDKWIDMASQYGLLIADYIQRNIA